MGEYQQFQDQAYEGDCSHTERSPSHARNFSLPYGIPNGKNTVMKDVVKPPIPTLSLYEIVWEYL